MTKENEFQNGKELLGHCRQRLTMSQRNTTGGNVAQYPVVIIMLGEKCLRFAGIIKNTLEFNWNNASHIKYLGMTYEEDWKVVRWRNSVGTGEPGWDDVGKGPCEAVYEAVQEMLMEGNAVFRNTTRIKMEFVMGDTEENEAQEYIELYLRFQNRLQLTELKTFYLMTNQTIENVTRSENILKYILRKYEKNKSSFGTLYLLSNCLNNGVILGEEQEHQNDENSLEEGWIAENYRLVADIILLGGDASCSGEGNFSLYNGFKTVSYTLLTKPIGEIAAVSLWVLMEEMYRQEEGRTKGISNMDFRERLKIRSAGGLELGEEIFAEKILPLLPCAQSLMHLPFSGQRELKKFRRINQDIDRGMEEVNALTAGGWSLYKKKNYLGVVGNFVNNKEEMDVVRDKVRRLLYGAFSIFEIIGLMSDKEKKKGLLNRLGEEYCYEGVSIQADSLERLHSRAVYECRKMLYEEIGFIVRNELEVYFVQAEQFIRNYNECAREIEEENYYFANMDKSIEAVYRAEVKRYVQEKQEPNSSESVFPKVFDAKLDKTELLRAIWGVFEDLTEKEIFRYDFAKELNYRMSQMPEVEREALGDMLKRNAGNHIRLRNLMDVTEKQCCYYMVNHSADYAGDLKKREGFGRDYLLFDLKRADCIEHIEVYRITDLDKVCLSS